MYVFMLLDEMGLGQHREVNMLSCASWGVALQLYTIQEL